MKLKKLVYRLILSNRWLRLILWGQSFNRQADLDEMGQESPGVSVQSGRYWE